MEKYWTQKHNNPAKRPEVREKQRQSALNSYINGRINPNKGIKQDKDIVEKRSELLRQRYASGELKPHNNGINFRSNEWREKIRLSLLGRKSPMKGRKQSEEAKQKMKFARCGLKNPNWKGGITPKLIKERNSINSKLWRLSVFERDKFTCQDCGQVGGTLNAHHIKQFSKFTELRFDVTNGKTLCVKCHRKYPKK